MTTLGRAASLRVAYASACQDVAMLREKNVALHDSITAAMDGLSMSINDWRVTPEECEAKVRAVYGVLLHAYNPTNLQEYKTATVRADAAEAEVARLKAEHAIALEEANVAQLRTVVKAGVFKAHMLRYQAFVAEEGVIYDSEMIGADVRCLACKERAYYKDNVQHKEDCIVLAAIKAFKAQKEAAQ